MPESTPKEAYESVRVEIELLFQELLSRADREVTHRIASIERNARLMKELRPERVTEIKLADAAVELEQELECAKNRQSRLVERLSGILAGLDTLRPGDGKMS